MDKYVDLFMLKDASVRVLRNKEEDSVKVIVSGFIEGEEWHYPIGPLPVRIAAEIACGVRDALRAR